MNSTSPPPVFSEYLSELRLWTEENMFFRWWRKVLPEGIHFNREKERASEWDKA